LKEPKASRPHMPGYGILDANSGNGLLPWSWKAIYRDCVMTQRSTKGATPKGRFQGRTTISGPVDLNGSVVEGTLIVNGRQIPRGNVGDIHQTW